MLSEKLMAIIVCPKCQGKLTLEIEKSWLLCESCQLAYPVEDGIPVMLIEEAVNLAPEKVKTPHSKSANSSDSTEEEEITAVSELERVEAEIDAELEQDSNWEEQLEDFPE
jgi:uncharacterized protein